MYYSNNSKSNIVGGSIDIATLLTYVALVAIGWLNIYAAVYNPENSGAGFDLSLRYNMQLVWIAVSVTLGVVILLVDKQYFHIFSYHVYWMAIMLMIGVLVFGKEVNGAKSWIGVGSIGIQPVEFMKIATALALARLMSSYSFSMGQKASLMQICTFIFLPIVIVLLQNDTGSALVFGAFFLVFYREGFGSQIYLVTFFFILVAILSFFITESGLTILIFLSAVLFEVLWGNQRQSLKPIVRYLAIVLALYCLLTIVVSLIHEKLEFNILNFIISVVVTLPLLVYHQLKGRSRTVLWFFGLFVAGVAVIYVVDYAFQHILQPHQQERILDLTGVVSDPRGAGYNAMQSKIAIGSGGMWGKGFLEGTQTRFSFVPEQSTDFIFCTIGEEWGFVGSIVVLVLFAVLIWRLMAMGERQKDAFGRIYCYGAAGILLVHTVINICMTLGLFPVIGIPLPFISYGGSSMMAFTILIFIALRLDGSSQDV